MNNVTSINKYKKLRHAPIALYQEGTEQLLKTVDKLESRRALAIGGLLGGLLTVSVVILISWVIAVLF